MKKILFIIGVLFFISKVSTAEASSVTIIYPNGGESFKIGQKINVTWSTQDIPTTENVFIRLKNETTGENYAQLGFISNDGAHELQIRPDLPEGKYRLFIQAGSNEDYSDNIITIESQNFDSDFITNAADLITTSSAQLNGTYSSLPYGNSLTFEYTTSSKFTKPSVKVLLVSEPSSKTEVSVITENLKPLTKYNYRLCFYGLNNQKICGKILSFKTLKLLIEASKNPYDNNLITGGMNYILLKKPIASNGKMKFYSVYTNPATGQPFNEKNQIYYSPKEQNTIAKFGKEFTGEGTLKEFIKSSNLKIKNNGYVIVGNFINGGTNYEYYTIIQ